MRYLSILILAAVSLIIMGFYSCSTIKKSLCRSETRYLEYILSDTTVCYMPELKIKDNRVYRFLDSALYLYNDCKHCITKLPVPEYFKIGGERTFNDNQIYLMHSYYTEEIPEYIDYYYGGFFYKETLFIVYNNINDMDNSLFEKTECSIRIERCNLPTAGSCLNATFSLNKKKIIEYNCNDPFPFVR